MTKQTNAINIKDIAQSYIFCFLDGPMSDSCVRHLAGEKVLGERPWGNAVFPTAKVGETCSMFKEYRLIRGAYGFDNLYGPVKAKDISSLRAAVKNYLGGNGTYYRYCSGVRMLKPEQQEAILAIFRRYGYTDVQDFDHYKDVVDL